MILINFKDIGFWGIFWYFVGANLGWCFGAVCSGYIGRMIKIISKRIIVYKYNNRS